ncbi:MAG: hypothetical protein K8S20_11865 [Chloroflexi bacterium]|nr:hypothetical protein [Chloroflexota bacterium]
MQFNSWLLDKKINGLNVSLDLSIEEYWGFAPDILHANEYQRKKVNANGKIYQLLARDLKSGCVIPPIILSVSGQIEPEIAGVINNCLENNIVDANSAGKLQIFIREAIAEKELIILDGLQRTFTIQECIRDFTENEEKNKFLKIKIRAEIYVGLSKPGILYRMITLNTGQTPMTLRHQIEILYQDYIDSDSLKDSGIYIVREVDNESVKVLGYYKFSDVADMYYSFTVGSPNSYSKETISTVLREHEFLEGFEPENQVDLSTLIETYHDFVKKLNELTNGWTLPEEDGDIYSEGLQLGGLPLGKDIPSIGSRVQVMAGFGAACNKLIALSQYENLGEVRGVIGNITLGNMEDPMTILIQFLDEIRANAKKIGDSQRAYFFLFFRHLFSEQHDSYLNLSLAVSSAKDAYDTNYSLSK